MVEASSPLPGSDYRLELDLLKQLEEALPDLSLDNLRAHGRKHVAHRQRALAELLVCSFERRFRHKADRNADSFSQEFLCEHLKADKGQYQKLLVPFFDFEQANAGYSKSRGHTKRYFIKAHVSQALDTVLSGVDPATAAVWRRDDIAIPANRTALQGARTYGTLTLPAMLPLAHEAIAARLQEVRDRALTEGLDCVLDGTEDGLAVRRVEECLKVIHAWAVSAGGIPNLYTVGRSGRLHPSGLSVVNMPRVVRQLVLQETGWTDYDIRACHASIFQSVCRYLAHETPCVDGYLSDRDAAHIRWQEITGRPAACHKAVVLSWLNGGRLTPHPSNAATQILGTDGVLSLRQDPLATGMLREIAVGVERIVERFSSGLSVLTNAVGAQLPLDPSVKARHRTAHLLTGWEQLAIRAACEQASPLHAVVYDGFIADPCDVAKMEEAIVEETMNSLGFPLALAIKATPYNRSQSSLEERGGEGSR